MNAAAIRILAVAAVAILGLVGLVVEESRARAAGAEVTLAMEAVDPRALLSGHYVAITLREALPPDQACPPGTDTTSASPLFPFNQTPTAPLWIALAPMGDHHAVAGAAKDRATAARFAPLVARGTVSCAPGRKPTAEEPEPLESGSVSLDLGVNRFYASQDEARRIDALMARRGAGDASPVSAILSIGGDGKARLKGLKVEGRRIELSLF